MKKKRKIFYAYTSNTDPIRKDFDKIVEVEEYFPLLCKLYSTSKKEYQKDGVRFFQEPETVLKEEITHYRKKSEAKYCALVLLCFFNNDLCVEDLKKNSFSEEIFYRVLNLCGMGKNTAPYIIGDNLKLLDGFVITVGNNTFRFYHDYVMEVTTYVFGTDYPLDTIKYADIGFLRRRVRLENCNNPLTICLSEKHINELGKRLFTEFSGDRILDVVLNPCLRNEKIIQAIINESEKFSNKIQSFLEKKRNKLEKQESSQTMPRVFMSKVDFVNLENEISLLFALTVFCHTDLSLYFFKKLQQMQIDFQCNKSLFPAVCANGSEELFDMFMKSDIKGLLTEKWGGLSPFHIASLFHNYNLLRKKTLGVNNVNLRSEDGLTALVLASGNDTEESNEFKQEKQSAIQRNKTVLYLLKKGAIINLCTENKTSPLFVACQNGHDDTVHLLLNRGADINLHRNKETSPLYISCQRGDHAIVKALLNNGADIKACEEEGASPLYIACQYGHESTASLLIQYGANVNFKSIEDGSSPLYTACQSGHAKIAKLLIRNHADKDLQTEEEKTPLFIASLRGYYDIVELLLSSKRAMVNLCTNTGISPFFAACIFEHENIMDLLFKFKADINVQQSEGKTPLHEACENGRDKIVDLLLKYGANINLCNHDGESPLHLACKRGYVSIVNYLLNTTSKQQADINLKTSLGITPLYTASQYNQYGVVELLLKKGADLNLCRNDGENPLYIACENGHDRIVKLLLDNKADINFKIKGETPLYIALRKGHVSTLQLLQGKGADINFRQKDGESPLHEACENGHNEIVDLLLKCGAIVNLCNKDGISPLHIACHKGNESTVQLLLKNNANINLRTNHGSTPLFEAKQNQHYDIVKLLEEKGADFST